MGISKWSRNSAEVTMIVLYDIRIRIIELKKKKKS